MNLVAKKNFTDKLTGKTYKEGEKIKVEKEVGERMLKSPYAVVEETKKEAQDTAQEEAQEN